MEYSELKLTSTYNYIFQIKLIQKSKLLDRQLATKNEYIIFKNTLTGWEIL